MRVIVAFILTVVLLGTSVHAQSYEYEGSSETYQIRGSFGFFDSGAGVQTTTTQEVVSETIKPAAPSQPAFVTNSPSATQTILRNTETPLIPTSTGESTGVSVAPASPDSESSSEEQRIQELEEEVEDLRFRLTVCEAAHRYAAPTEPFMIGGYFLFFFGATMVLLVLGTMYLTFKIHEEHS